MQNRGVGGVTLILGDVDKLLTFDAKDSDSESERLVFAVSAVLNSKM
jgi:hypothetical protein